jgi:streptogramin lyase
MKSAIKHYSLLVAIPLTAVNALAQSSITPNTPGIIATFVKPAAARPGMRADTQPIGLTTSVVASGTSGEFYFASPDQNRVYKVLENGQLEIVAGSAEGFSGNTGDGGPATEALLKSPFALAIDGDQNLYICDEGNGRIRKVDAAGIISTVPINVLAPKAMTTDSSGNLYVVEAARSRILRITPMRGVTTVAGNGMRGFTGDGGSALLAQISPDGIATDSSGIFTLPTR